MDFIECFVRNLSWFVRCCQENGVEGKRRSAGLVAQHNDSNGYLATLDTALEALARRIAPF